MTSNVLCRYYAAGACAFGDKCRFSHNKEDEPSQVCKYYLAGNCAYGDKCRYQHSKPGWSSRGQPAPQSNYSAPSGVPKPATGGQSGGSMVKLPSGASEFGFVEGAPNWDDFMTPDEMDEFEQWQAEQALAAAGHGSRQHSASYGEDDGDIMDPADIPLCEEYAATGQCSAGDDCCYVHGEQCEMCGYFCIHLYNPDITAHHQLVCSEAMAAAAGQAANGSITANGTTAAAAPAGDGTSQPAEDVDDGAAVADDSRQVELSDTVGGATVRQDDADEEEVLSSSASGADKAAAKQEKAADAGAAVDQLAEKLASTSVSS